MSIRIPTDLTDPQLLEALTRAAHDERGATALLVAHLAEMDARTLHLGLGFSSLFEYCLEVLRLSESATCKRIEVARAAQRFPVLLDRLAEGALSLTSARLLASHLTSENHRELIAAAAGLRKRAVEEMIARRFPKPDVATLVRKLPARAPLPAVVEASDGMGPAPGASRVPPDATDVTPTAPAAAFVPPASPPPPLATPLSADRYQIRFTASGQTWEKLRVARDLLRHAVPSGDAGEIIDRALTALIAELARKKLAVVKKPARRGRATAARSPRPREGAARGVEARQGTMRLRGAVGPALRGARPAGVAPRRAVRGRRTVHGREHPAAVPRAQRVRGGPLPGTGRTRLERTRVGERGAGAAGNVWVECARLNRPRGRLGCSTDVVCRRGRRRHGRGERR